MSDIRKTSSTWLDIALIIESCCVILWLTTTPFIAWAILVSSYGSNYDSWPIALAYSVFNCSVLVQIIISLTQLNRSDRVVQRVVATGLLLAAPLACIAALFTVYMLMFILAIIPSTSIDASVVGWVIIITGLAINLIGSIWLWLLIGTKKKI